MASDKIDVSFRSVRLVCGAGLGARRFALCLTFEAAACDRLSRARERRSMSGLVWDVAPGANLSGLEIGLVFDRWAADQLPSTHIAADPVNFAPVSCIEGCRIPFSVCGQKEKSNHRVFCTILGSFAVLARCGLVLQALMGIDLAVGVLDGVIHNLPRRTDTDMCLRVREAGYRVVSEVGSALRQHECQTRSGVVTPEE